jgi:hypothetical protein
LDQYVVAAVSGTGTTEIMTPQNHSTTTTTTTTTTGAVEEALKFIVHFVGDVHQPLHVSRISDRGGNSITVHTNFTHPNTVQPPSEQSESLNHSLLRGVGRGGANTTTITHHHSTNLHSVWDSILLETYQEEKCNNNWTQLQEVIYELIDESSIRKWGRCAE